MTCFVAPVRRGRCDLAGQIVNGSAVKRHACSASALIPVAALLQAPSIVHVFPLLPWVRRVTLPAQPVLPLPLCVHCSCIRACLLRWRLCAPPRRCTALLMVSVVACSGHRQSPCCACSLVPSVLSWSSFAVLCCFAWLPPLCRHQAEKMVSTPLSSACRVTWALPPPCRYLRWFRSLRALCS